jgi:hypothetical protein
VLTGLPERARRAYHGAHTTARRPPRREAPQSRNTRHSALNRSALNRSALNHSALNRSARAAMDTVQRPPQSALPVTLEEPHPCHTHVVAAMLGGVAGAG